MLILNCLQRVHKPLPLLIWKSSSLWQVWCFRKMTNVFCSFRLTFGNCVTSYCTKYVVAGMERTNWTWNIFSAAIKVRRWHFTSKFFFLLLLNNASPKDTHLCSSTVARARCFIHWTSSVCTLIPRVLRQQLQTPPNKATRKRRGSSHLFSQTDKDLGTWGETAPNNLTETPRQPPLHYSSQPEMKTKLFLSFSITAKCQSKYSNWSCLRS